MSQGAGVASHKTGAVSSNNTGAVSSNNTGAAAARILDVGCGINKYPGSIGVDRNANTRADVLCDLDRFPYPFRDSSFAELRAIHVIEHVSDVIRAMAELHRVVVPCGGMFHGRTD